MILIAALILAANVLLLTVQVQRLTKERDRAIQSRDESIDALRRMAEERVFDRVRLSVVRPGLQPGSRQAN